MNSRHKIDDKVYIIGLYNKPNKRLQDDVKYGVTGYGVVRSIIIDKNSVKYVVRVDSVDSDAVKLEGVNYNAYDTIVLENMIYDSIETANMMCNLYNNYYINDSKYKLDDEIYAIIRDSIIIHGKIIEINISSNKVLYKIDSNGYDNNKDAFASLKYTLEVSEKYIFKNKVDAEKYILYADYLSEEGIREYLKKDPIRFYTMLFEHVSFELSEIYVKYDKTSVNKVDYIDVKFEVKDAASIFCIDMSFYREYIKVHIWDDLSSDSSDDYIEDEKIVKEYNRLIRQYIKDTNE